MANFSTEEMEQARRIILKPRSQGMTALVERMRVQQAIEDRRVPKVEGIIADRVNTAIRGMNEKLWMGFDFGQDDSFAVSYTTFPSYGGLRRGDGPSFAHVSEVATYPPVGFHWWTTNGDVRAGVGEAPKRAVCVITPEEEAAENPSMDIPRVTIATAQASVDELLADTAYKAEVLLGYSGLREHLKLQSPLMAILAELEIEPLDADAVEAYKKQAALYRSRQLKQEVMARTDFPKMSQWQVDSTTRAVWGRTEISDYGHEIPPHALALAVSIAERTQDTHRAFSFHIDELHDDPFLVVECEASDEEYYLAVWDESSFEANRHLL